MRSRSFARVVLVLVRRFRPGRRDLFDVHRADGVDQIVALVDVGRKIFPTVASSKRVRGEYQSSSLFGVEIVIPVER